MPSSLILTRLEFLLWFFFPLEKSNSTFSIKLTPVGKWNRSQVSDFIQLNLLKLHLSHLPVYLFKVGDNWYNHFYYWVTFYYHLKKHLKRIYHLLSFWHVRSISYYVSGWKIILYILFIPFSWLGKLLISLREYDLASLITGPQSCLTQWN